MKTVLWVFIGICPLMALQIPTDYPYFCSESEVCDDSCDPGSVVCTVAATLPYPTYCANVVVPGKSVRCVARDMNHNTVADSGTSKCTGCDSGGGIGSRCEPGSGAWWVGCDPFAF